MRTLGTPRMIRTRDAEIHEEVLELVFGVPYADLLREMQALGCCEESDVIHLGRRVLRDLVHLARGEISTISVPARLPLPGEYAEEKDAWRR